MDEIQETIHTGRFIIVATPAYQKPWVLFESVDEIMDFGPPKWPLVFIYDKYLLSY